jgi:hypothetical protein
MKDYEFDKVLQKFEMIETSIKHQSLYVHKAFEMLGRLETITNEMQANFRGKGVEIDLRLNEIENCFKAVRESGRTGKIEEPKLSWWKRILKKRIKK